MSEQDRKIKLLYNLNVISTLTPGYVLSTSSMTIIDHNSWRTSFWRRYAGENRKDTIAFIKSIFVEALSLISYSPVYCPQHLQCNCVLRQNIIDGIKCALKGFSCLKETYKGDYYAIAEIDQIITNINLTVNKISAYQSMPNDIISEPDGMDKYIKEEYTKELILDEYIDDVNKSESKDTEFTGGILDEMISYQEPSQKIFSTENKSPIIGATENTPNIEPIVSTSDTGDNSKTVDVTDSIDIPKSDHIVVDDYPFHVNKELLKTTRRVNLVNDEREMRRSERRAEMAAIQEKKAILIARIQSAKMATESNELRHRNTEANKKSEEINSIDNKKSEEINSIKNIDNNELRHRNIEANKKSEEINSIKNSDNNELRYRNVEVNKKLVFPEEMNSIKNSVQTKYGMVEEKKNTTRQKISTNTMYSLSHTHNPPIVRLAAAFKQWIETFETDQINEGITEID